MKALGTRPIFAGQEKGRDVPPTPPAQGEELLDSIDQPTERGKWITLWLSLMGIGVLLGALAAIGGVGR